jgi:hypothetical protein
MPVQYPLKLLHMHGNGHIYSSVVYLEAAWARFVNSADPSAQKVLHLDNVGDAQQAKQLCFNFKNLEIVRKISRSTLSFCVFSSKLSVISY